MNDPSNLELQQEICQKFGAPCLPIENDLKVGISKKFNAHQFPINGLRHPPKGDATGWYIWSGEEYSTNADFFVPLHAMHLNDSCQEIVKFLGLAPGWRFLFAPGQEDVWFDAKLLNL